MASSLVSAAKRKIRGSGSSSSDSGVSSLEGKKVCNFTTFDSISSETSTDELPTTQNMEKITTQLHVQAIPNRLDSVETKFGKLEGLFELLENEETAVSKNCVDLNNMNEKTKAIQNNVEEIEKGIVFAKSRIEEVIQKDEKNIRRIKDLVEKLLYQEIWLPPPKQHHSFFRNVHSLSTLPEVYRREHLHLFGIPEVTHGPEDTPEVLHKFCREELNIDPGSIEFQGVHRLGKKVHGQSRPIIAHFPRFLECVLVFRCVCALSEAADTDVKVYDDYPHEIRER